VAIVMADHYYDPTSNYEITDGAEDCRRYKDCPEEADLELNITSEKISETDFIVLGNIKNSGSMDWDNIMLKAELFNSRGEFIEECTEILDATLKPDTSQNFKLSCSSCAKVNLEDYASHKVEIISANNW
ncbi:MAG TPA: hypothetical protein DCF62_11380, partial [Porticoccaceae bacterium]|nr:hypothetical protein [Porticoccaceae bacterium]